MRDKVRARVQHMSLYVTALLKWLAVGALVGGVGGFVGAAFHLGVNYATNVRMTHPWVLYLLPLGGVSIAALYRLCRLEGAGTNAVIESVHFGKKVPTLLVPLIFVATVITHLCGGMSGVFAALFGTPLTATIFALEVISVGALYYAGLVPCITAALTGYLVSLLMGVPPTRFTITTPELSVVTMLLVVVLAIGCAVVSILFCQGLHVVEHQAARLLKNPFLRAFVGGVLIILLTLLVGNTDYNGAGMDVITRAMAGQASPWAWVLKLLFTAVTIGFGFRGGEVVPSFFVGATFGCVAGAALGLPAGFSAAVGLVAVFCGAVNCPIASVFMSIELFGAGDLLYFAMACAISYLLSGYCGLYSSQTILYAKLRAEFINVHAKE